jgi:hypothetical protein
MTQSAPRPDWSIRDAVTLRYEPIAPKDRRRWWRIHGAQQRSACSPQQHPRGSEAVTWKSAAATIPHRRRLPQRPPPGSGCPAFESRLCRRKFTPSTDMVG